MELASNSKSLICIMRRNEDLMCRYYARLNKKKFMSDFKAPEKISKGTKVALVQERFSKIAEDRGLLGKHDPQKTKQIAKRNIVAKNKFGRQFSFKKVSLRQIEA